MSVSGYTKVGADAKFGVAGMPSYAPAGLANRFSPLNSAYNWKASNTRKFRNDLGKAAAGTGTCDIVWIGDSLLPGYNGSITVDSASAPRNAAAVLAATFGVAQAGNGIQVCVPGGNSSPSDRFVSTGTVSYGGVFDAGLLTMNPGSTLTYTSQQDGTIASIFYGDNSGAFTYQIDGGTAVPVTPGGTNALVRINVTGLTSATHVIKINSTNTTYMFGVGVLAASGIASHNLALGGTAAAAAGGASWLGTTNWYSFGVARQAMINVAGITPSLVVCCLGSNDSYYGATSSQVTTALTSIRAFWPNSDFALIAGWERPGDPAAASWDTAVGARYALADTLDVPLIDWQDRVGKQSVAQANGSLGVDNTHPTLATSTMFGRALGQLFAS